jgi:hypothetical protein
LGDNATGSIEHFSAPLDFFDIPVEYPPINVEVALSSLRVAPATRKKAHSNLSNCRFEV